MDHVNISDLAAAPPPFLYLTALSGLHYIGRTSLSLTCLLRTFSSRLKAMKFNYLYLMSYKLFINVTCISTANKNIQST